MSASVRAVLPMDGRSSSGFWGSPERGSGRLRLRPQCRRSGPRSFTGALVLAVVLSGAATSVAAADGSCSSGHESAKAACAAAASSGAVAGTVSVSSAAPSTSAGAAVGSVAPTGTDASSPAASGAPSAPAPQPGAAASPAPPSSAASAPAVTPAPSSATAPTSSRTGTADKAPAAKKPASGSSGAGDHGAKGAPARQSGSGAGSDGQGRPVEARDRPADSGSGRQPSAARDPSRPRPGKDPSASGNGPGSGSNSGNGQGSSSGEGQGSNSGKGDSGQVKPVPPTSNPVITNDAAPAPSTPVAGPVAGASVTSGNAALPVLPVLSVPASAGAHRVRAGRVSSSIAPVAASWPVALAARAQRPVLAGPSRRGASDSVAVDAARPDPRARRPVEAFGPRAGLPFAWSSPAMSVSAPRDAAGTARTADRRPARSVGSSGGGGGLPVPSPFGPPGRGVVAGVGGVASAAAGSGVVAAILVAGLFVVLLQPLRRFRLVSVMAGPVGFVSLQQRPG
jgi:hypothetical protein